MRFPTGDHSPTTDQLSLGRSYCAIWASLGMCHRWLAVTLQLDMAVLMQWHRRWQELAWLRRGRSEASKRLTVSTFHRSTGHFATDESPSPTWGQDRCLSPLGPSWALSGTPFWTPFRTPFWGPFWDPLRTPQKGGPGGAPRGGPRGGPGRPAGGPRPGGPRARPGGRNFAPGRTGPKMALSGPNSQIQ